MWLFVPSTSSASAAVAEDSTSGSTSQPVEPPAVWCTSSGKPLPRPASWSGWRRRPWVRLLSGTTSPPSMLARGVEQWIASLVALRARTSPSQASRPGSTENAPDSSLSRSALPTSARPRSSSGRTSAVQGELFPPSSPSLSATATSALPSSFALLTWERPISGPASSCWPTAAVSDSRSSARGTTTGVMHPGTSLTDAMREWATPAAGLANYTEPPETFAARSEALVARGSRPLGVNLGQQAQTWRTPTARDGSTTGARDPEERLSQGHSVGLKDQVTTWQTLRASDGDKGGPNQTLRGKPSLTAQASTALAWPTPAARDAKGANGPEHLAKERGHHDQLPNAVALWSGHPVPETSTGGPESSPPTPSSRRLNPAFVEWLMGWPPGWSMPSGFGPTGSGSSETASCLPKPRRRSRSSGSTSKGGSHDAG